ncbi:MAG: hypothetical protein IIW52_05330 [Alistipes sp.]|nr:hypothetical protein [Alistipes sp.]
MADFNSKYSGEETEKLLDRVATSSGEALIYYTSFNADDVFYAQQGYDGRSVNITQELIDAINRDSIIIVPKGEDTGAYTMKVTPYNDAFRVSFFGGRELIWIDIAEITVGNLPLDVDGTYSDMMFKGEDDIPLYDANRYINVDGFNNTIATFRLPDTSEGEYTLSTLEEYITEFTFEDLGNLVSGTVTSIPSGGTGLRNAILHKKRILVPNKYAGAAVAVEGVDLDKHGEQIRLTIVSGTSIAQVQIEAQSGIIEQDAVRIFSIAGIVESIDGIAEIVNDLNSDIASLIDLGGGEKYVHEVAGSGTIKLQSNTLIYIEQDDDIVIDDSSLNEGETSRVAIETSFSSITLPVTNWINGKTPVFVAGGMYELSFTQTPAGLLGVWASYPIS